MEIKRFVDENSLEHVKSFVETLASLEGVTCGETVRTIKYFIKNREEREVEEAKIKAEKELADLFALQLGVTSWHLNVSANVDNEVVISFGKVKYVVKVLRKV